MRNTRSNPRAKSDAICIPCPHAGFVRVRIHTSKGSNTMNRPIALGLTLLAGVAIGGLAIQGLHAQAKPPVYYIAENDVTNPEAYAKEYLPRAQELIKANGGRYVAAGKATPLE